MSSFLNGKAYAIIKSNMISKKVHNKSRSSFCFNDQAVRTSLNGQLTLVKFKLPLPEEALELTLYTQEEILAILSTEDWEVNPDE